MVSYYSPEKAGVYLQKAKEILQSGEHNLIRVSEYVYEAREAKMGFQCRIKVFAKAQMRAFLDWLRDYIFLVLVCGFVGIWTLWKIRRWQVGKKQRKVVVGFYQDLREFMSENPIGLSQAEIYQKYLKLP